MFRLAVGLLQLQLALALQPMRVHDGCMTTNEMADLAIEISQLDELAWGYEDREQLSKASAARAKMRTLKARLDALVAASRQP